MWLHRGQFWGVGGETVKCAGSACTLPGGTAKRSGQVKARPDAGLAVVLTQVLGCGTLILEPPSAFCIVTCSSSGIQHLPVQNFSGCYKAYHSPALPRARSPDTPRRRGPDSGEQEGSPVTGTGQRGPKVRVDWGRRNSLARSP